MEGNYEDLVELGFEGLDHFATKYHDHVYGRAPNVSSLDPRRVFRRKRDPAPPGRAASEPSKDRELPSDDEDTRPEYPRRDSMYMQDRNNGYGGGENERHDDYYPPPPPVGDRGRGKRDNEDETYSYAVVRRGGGGASRDASPDWTNAVRPYNAPPYDPYASRGRPRFERMRSSSYSPPRRQQRYESPPRRVRSKSPNHHRAVATIVGALAGGFAGHNVRKGHDSTISTVGGAIVGGIAGREIEKQWDRYQDRKAEKEWREQQREKRRRERDRDRDDDWR